MSKEDVFEALGACGRAAAALAAAGPNPDPSLRSRLAAARLRYENCYEAYMLGLDIAMHRARGSLA
ncbi:MAG TPA: hypothetical protein VG755_22045 [Nannocystaceae bacterium]|nr:hypothetical protein [Nannocystaceae bacterium]